MSAIRPESIFIIIPVHNRRSLTLACLENLRQTGDLDRYSIVVVDDGSTDGTTAAIESHYPLVTVLAGDGNLWWTGAIALGMRFSYQQGAKYVIWLNDDCQFEPETLDKLVAFAQESPVSIIGCQGMELDNPNTISFGGKRKTWKGYRLISPPTDEVTACDLLSGNLVCLPRSVIDKIGYPDPLCVPHYGGDTLYLIRAVKAGFKVFVDTRSKVFNLPGEPKLYPKCWLSAPGDPLRILRLVFIPHSGLSWKVWWQINWEAYGLWGTVMFCKKYLSILIITFLRFLPSSLRQFSFYEG